MNRCTKCDAPLAPGTAFCANCGTPAVAQPPMGTPQLGARLDLPETPVSAQGRGTTGMEYKILGTVMQVVVLELDPGETIYSEGGGMAWMSQSIVMNTTGRGGGIGGIFKRAISGESLFLNEFTSQGGKGSIAFASDFPGKIVPVALGPGQEMIVQKQAFLCAEKTVGLEIHFRKKIGAGFFGGEGFIMQKLTGPGIAFVSLDGEIVEYTLQPGEMLRVDTGHVAMYEPTVEYDIEVMKGFKNVLLGGEGLFLTTLRGPGRIWLQTMPMLTLARSIGQYLPSSGSSGGGAINIGNLFD